MNLINDFSDNNKKLPLVSNTPQLLIQTPPHLIQTSTLLPWSEKYRPLNISNIIYHEKITRSIMSYMDNNKLPHLLFYGPPGTGKTSTILAIAKHYYKEDFSNMIMVLNASEERGIETVRNRIKQFVTTIGLYENPDTPPFKLIILDEIDAMTEDAQAILRKVVEKYVNNVRFCFICNYLKKVNNNCTDKQISNTEELIKYLMKENSEFKHLLIDQNRKLLELTKEVFIDKCL